MARIDIQMDYSIGELDFNRNITNKLFYELITCSDLIPEAEKFYLAEIVVNPEFEKRIDKGIYLNIPYIPVFKPLLLRFRIDNGTDRYDYVLNKFNNSIWFEVVVNKGIKTELICISQYYKVNGEGYFYLMMNKDSGCFHLYSGFDSDLIFNVSQKQNEAFLLKAFASNIYQYPLTGVGLLNYLNSNLESSGLADKLKKKFENDNMTINNAYLNSDSGNIILDVVENG